MAQDRIIGTIHCSNRASNWTEYLCMEVAPDGSVTLTSKSYEVVGWESGLDDADVVWPEGLDPAKMEEWDNLPDPVSINGKKVTSVEDGIYLGGELLQHSDDSSATFKSGERERAVIWVQEYYRNAYANVDEEVLATIGAAFQKA